MARYYYYQDGTKIMRQQAPKLIKKRFMGQKVHEFKYPEILADCISKNAAKVLLGFIKKKVGQK